MKKIIIIFLISISNSFIFNSVYAGEIPNRIVSLAPNITEILFAMDLGDRIAGVTNFCDYPEGAKKIPKIGGMSNPSLEAVVSLKPDIVVLTTDGNQKEFNERLHSLKIKTYVFKARRLSELPQGIRDMGTALGEREKANSLASEIEVTISKFKNMFQSKQNNKILFIIWPEPLIVAGHGTAIDDAITLLGGKNIASKAKIPYPKYSIEEIIRQAPDVIFIGRGHTNIKEASKGLMKKISIVPAVRTGDVFYLSDSLYRLGPRVLKGIEEMAACLRQKH
jgi:iron complex transport system substrate-binding protein